MTNKPWKIRFWEKVDFTDDHWLWTRSVDTSGYGLFKLNGKLEKAHRVGYFLHYGFWPKNKALHYCDTPLCVRGIHIYDGTSKENARDREIRSRSNRRRGSYHGMSKLNEADVSLVKTWLREGYSQIDIAKEMNVSTFLINKIALGKTWSHL